jgi:hypothetical protein
MFGREHEHQVERHAEVDARADAQIILLFLHRNDPAIEQIDRFDRWRPRSSIISRPLLALN